MPGSVEPGKTPTVSQSGSESKSDEAGFEEKTSDNSGSKNTTAKDETSIKTGDENKDENNYDSKSACLDKEAVTDLSKVVEVIDGDTFKIENFGNVRLLGINTPETGMFFYEEAKEVLRIIAEGKDVCLEKDLSERDQYGRLLRYAFYGNLFINLELLQRGFANIFIIPPDIKYQKIFLEAERYAMENNLGLWERSTYSFKKGHSGQGETAIIININWDAKGDDKKNMNDEYVVMLNNSGQDINIAGWTVKDSGRNIYEFKKYIFSTGSEIILYTGQGSDGNGEFYWNSDMPVWNNSGDTFYLRDKDGLLVEIFNY